MVQALQKMSALEFQVQFHQRERKRERERARERERVSVSEREVSAFIMDQTLPWRDPRICLPIVAGNVETGTWVAPGQ